MAGKVVRDKNDTFVVKSDFDLPIKYFSKLKNALRFEIPRKKRKRLASKPNPTKEHYNAQIKVQSLFR
ncbi:MAG: hypothetical protein ACFFCZ_08750 [Promethearchaeota archaeon]